jgi:hypothetical protein
MRRRLASSGGLWVGPGHNTTAPPGLPFTFIVHETAQLTMWSCSSRWLLQRAVIPPQHVRVAPSSVMACPGQGTSRSGSVPAAAESRLQSQSTIDGFFGQARDALRQHPRQEGQIRC